ncbi:Protein CBG25431 [Caenorhabditis briggsae]|uniref:Protein CBG25431 n=1 Tax=Caenorhabditis briggsae TaxID=6238 RepID=B6ILC4_CAEBR|nr:Protein CBG25431 [Caenorhabditis briggsae]CAS00704.1 Protein CBG25431 [Caenorhabditis briggsae]
MVTPFVRCDPGGLKF